MDDRVTTKIIALKISRFQAILAVGCAGLVFLMTACSSNKYAVKEVDTKIEQKGSVGGGKVGVDDAGQAIIQTETEADDELRTQIWKNSEFEAKLNSEHQLLKQCRQERADPRLGGSGDVVEIPEIDKMSTATEIKEDLGITKTGSLKVIKREMYIDRLARERKLETSLGNLVSLVRKHRDKCEVDLGHTRVQHGLPSKR